MTRPQTTISRYRIMLAKARARFMHYADNHREKLGTKFEPGTPAAADTLAKAQANDAIASEILAELEQPVLETDYEFMVAKLQKPGEKILEQMTPLKIMCLHMAGGAASEGGELFDAIKRWALFGKELDLVNVREELGDLEFFIAGLRQNLGITREETLVENMEKLGQRYVGHVFSDEATIARADKAPPPEVAAPQPFPSSYAAGSPEAAEAERKDAMVAGALFGKQTPRTADMPAQPFSLDAGSSEGLA